MLEQLKVPLIIVGVILLVLAVVFLWLLVAGADMRRRGGPDREREDYERKLKHRLGS